MARTRKSLSVAAQAPGQLRLGFSGPCRTLTVLPTESPPTPAASQRTASLPATPWRSLPSTPPHHALQFTPRRSPRRSSLSAQADTPAQCTPQRKRLSRVETGEKTVKPAAPPQPSAPDGARKESFSAVEKSADDEKKSAKPIVATETSAPDHLVALALPRSASPLRWSQRRRSRSRSRTPPWARAGSSDGCRTAALAPWASLETQDDDIPASQPYPEDDFDIPAAQPTLGFARFAATSRAPTPPPRVVPVDEAELLEMLRTPLSGSTLTQLAPAADRTFRQVVPGPRRRGRQDWLDVRKSLKRRMTFY